MNSTLYPTHFYSS